MFNILYPLQCPRLFSLSEPPFTIKGPEKQSVSEGSRINLECIFGGSPTPTVAWVFNGKLLTNSRTVRVHGKENVVEWSMEINNKIDK